MCLQISKSLETLPTSALKWTLPEFTVVLRPCWNLRNLHVNRIDHWFFDDLLQPFIISYNETYQ